MMKQLETRTVQIGDNMFYIRPFPAFKAANMSGELAALVMPMLSGLAPLLNSVDASKSNGGLFDLSVEDAAPAISQAFSSISGDQVERILKHLLIAGNNVSFGAPDDDPKILTEDLANEVFCADVQDMFLLAFEVIRSNYNGFFKKLGGQFGSQVAGMTAKMPSRQNAMANSI